MVIQDGEMKKCSGCGEDYQGYTYLVKDDPEALEAERVINEDFGNLCTDCLAEVREELIDDGLRALPSNNFDTTDADADSPEGWFRSHSSLGTFLYDHENFPLQASCEDTVEDGELLCCGGIYDKDRRETVVNFEKNGDFKEFGRRVWWHMYGMTHGGYNPERSK